MFFQKLFDILWAKRITLFSIVILLSLANCNGLRPSSNVQDASGKTGLPSPGPTPTPIPTPSPNTTSQLTDIGVNIHLDSSSNVKQMADMGAKWVRIDMNWSIMEPADGQWSFQVFDDVVTTAKQNGFKIYASLGSTPVWASSNGQTNGIPDATKWKTFVQTAVARYKDQVSAFGIWNEPNLQQFWVGSLDQFLTTIFKPSCDAIRAIDSHIIIAGPELAHLYSATIENQSFYNGIKDAGLSSCLDVITHHVYADSDFTNDLSGYYFAGILYKSGLLQWLQNSGLANKPVWITEFGYDVKGGTEAKQAQLITDQLTAMHSLGWIQRAFVFEMIDDTSPTATYQTGILRGDRSQRPVYSAIHSTIGGF